MIGEKVQIYSILITGKCIYHLFIKYETNIIFK